MFKKQWLAVAVLVMATFSLSISSCSDDDPAGPGGGGGGGGVGSKMAAGVYNVTLSEWTCGMTDTMTVTLQEVICSEFSFDELFELDCPVIITNDSFSIDCTSTEDDNGCSYTERAQVTGTKVGNIWTIMGTITISNENPANCSNDPACANVMVVIEMVSAPPSACTFAGVNLIEATVVGGPLAGNTDFETFGAGSGAGGIYMWDFSGAAGSFIPTQLQAVLSSNLANLNVTLNDVDANSLPATFSVSVMGGGAQASPALSGAKSSSTLPSGFALYYDQTTAGASFFSTGGSGSITVNEVSDTHIAGTINSLSIDGMLTPAGGGTPTPATRSLSGGFHVRSDSFAATESVPRKGWVGRILSKW